VYVFDLSTVFNTAVSQLINGTWQLSIVNMSLCHDGSKILSRIVNSLLGFFLHVDKIQSTAWSERAVLSVLSPNNLKLKARE